ncbi:MAG: 8-amino-7-oxononanoate synthase [Verrucomicrobiota bacterium]
MTTAFDIELKQRLDALREQNLFRELRRVDSAQSPRIQIDGKPFLNFSSNDYLGFANDPLLKDAAIEAVKKFGAGSGSSRLICGSLAPHHELEETLAQFKKTEAALVFSTGYAAAVGTISALVGKDDIIIIDKLVHASIVDAARLSGAKLRVFSHNDLDDLEKILKWAQKRAASILLADQRPKILIITESVFSMDGDFAPLKQIIALKEKYGAWLMVDEAHATGIFGKNGRGFAEECGVSEQIEIQMGTLGKALGVSGGYVCGSRNLIDYLINRARSFIFSTAPVPAAAAAATAAIRFIQSSAGEKRRNLLWKRLTQFRSKFGGGAMGSEFRVHAVGEPPESGTPNLEIQVSEGSPIIPLIIGEENKALEIAAHLRTRGIFIPAIRYPTVARGAARLRLTVTAAHTTDDVEQLCDALGKLELGKHRTSNIER